MKAVSRYRSCPNYIQEVNVIRKDIPEPMQLRMEVKQILAQ